MFWKKKSETESVPAAVESFDDKKTDYSKSYLTKQHICLFWGFASVVISVAIHIFYLSWIPCIISPFLAYLLIPVYRKSRIKKRKDVLLIQFKDMMDSLSASLGAGRNVPDSFKSAWEDLKIQYDDDSDIILEVSYIVTGMQNNDNVEGLVADFARRSGLDDIRNFADVFDVCYRKGGNTKEIIQRTSNLISEKINILLELQTMVTSTKTEQNVMTVMPVAVIALLTSMGGDQTRTIMTSITGRLSTTAALVIFIAAYFISRKILDIKF